MLWTSLRTVAFWGTENAVMITKRMFDIKTSMKKKKGILGCARPTNIFFKRRFARQLGYLGCPKLVPSWNFFFKAWK